MAKKKSRYAPLKMLRSSMGRPVKYTEDQLQSMMDMRERGMTYKQIAQCFDDKFAAIIYQFSTYIDTGDSAPYRPKTLFKRPPRWDFAMDNLNVHD